MKNIPFILLFAILAISIYSCQKETTVPTVESEEFVVYETTYTATDRGANTANITWSTTNGAVDARFEIEEISTGTILYSYGWINFTSDTNTGNYSVPTGNTVKLRIKAKKASGVGTTPTLSYTFSSSCTITGCGCSSFSVTAPNSIPFSSIPGNSLTTGGCL